MKQNWFYHMFFDFVQPLKKCFLFCLCHTFFIVGYYLSPESGLCVTNCPNSYYADQVQYSTVEIGTVEYSTVQYSTGFGINCLEINREVFSFSRWVSDISCCAVCSNGKLSCGLFKNGNMWRVGSEISCFRMGCVVNRYWNQLFQIGVCGKWVVVKSVVSAWVGNWVVKPAVSEWGLGLVGCVKSAFSEWGLW